MCTTNISIIHDRIFVKSVILFTNKNEETSKMKIPRCFYCSLGLGMLCKAAVISETNVDEIYQESLYHVKDRSQRSTDLYILYRCNIQTRTIILGLTSLLALQSVCR